MKPFICYVITLMCLFLSGCSSSNEINPTPPTPSTQESEGKLELNTPTATPSFTESPFSHTAFPETPIREYGESTAYIQMEEDLVVRILYPETEIPELNLALNDWVLETVSEYQTECIGCHTTGDCGELTAEYESYLVQDQFVSIKVSGIFDKPYLAHPIDIIATFHADLKSGQLITLDHLLLPQGRSALENMVATNAGVELALIDTNFLNHWLLTSEGLEITLARGDYLPMSDGTKTFLYTFEQLDGILSLSKNTIPEPVPSKEPVTIPPENNMSYEPQNLSINPDKPMVALTFDDGPSKHTDRLLDIFATYSGKGTFFVIGNILDNRPEVLQRMINEGHEIGGHSWDHRQLTKLNSVDLKNQLETTQTKIQEITNKKSHLLRPPYGSYNSEVQNTCASLNLVVVNWSLDTLDWKHKDADKIYNTIMQEIQDGDIILCHDLHGSTVDAMERVIPELIEKGYQLVTVSELLNQRSDVIRAGEVYYKR